MNWESKFSSIVQETEANLAKVKEKLRGKATHSPTVTFDSTYYSDYSRQSPRLTTSTQYPVSSTPKSRLTDHSPTYTTHSSLSRSSQPSTFQLQSKIDEQSKTIDELRRMVRSLEKERGEYQDQIRQLRNEISKLSTQMLDQSTGSNSNPHLEWQMDQMKRTLLREVQEVRDQLRLFRQRVDKHSSTEHNTSLSINKDIDEVRHDIQEELHYLRRDLDVLRRRLGSVEMGVRSAHYDKKDLERTQDRMNSSLREITNGHTRNLVDVLRTCPDADRGTNHLQVDQLRSTVQRLKDKLDRVETRLHDVTSPYKPSSGAFRTVTKRETTRTYKPDVELDVDSDYDDVDLSSDLSVDLEDSDIEVSTSVTRRPARTVSTSPEPEISDDDVDDDVDDAHLGASSIGSADLDDDDLDIDDLDIDNDIDV